MKNCDYRYVVIYERKDFRSKRNLTTTSFHGFQLYSSALCYAATCKSSKYCVRVDVVNQVHLRQLLSCTKFFENNFREINYEKIR